MNFSCSVNELFDFYDKVISEKPKTDDFISLNKNKKPEQLEIDFEFYGSIKFEIKKEEKPQNKTISFEENNRQLMIKYKYDTITDFELNCFYKNIEKLIFKIIKKNYVTENFNDVCNEIWKRIAKYKHKWDENNGTCVSTWISKVALNVINTIRKKNMTYSSRNVSYDGMFVYDKHGQANEVDVEALVEMDKDNSGEERKNFYDNMLGCFNNLNEIERMIVELCLNGDSNSLILDGESRIYKRKYASATFIKKKLNLTTNQYKKYMKSIGEKYVKSQN